MGAKETEVHDALQRVLKVPCEGNKGKWGHYLLPLQFHPVSHDSVCCSSEKVETLKQGSHLRHFIVVLVSVELL